MVEFLVIFSLAIVGSLTRLSADLMLTLVARKTQSGTIAAGPGRDLTVPSTPSADPILKFGFILACDGIIVLALVSALPGSLALERTGLAFALLCVGGLIGEISSTGAARQIPAPDANKDASAGPRSVSRQLSLALTLMLDLSFAVLSSGQGLIEIVPTNASNGGYAQELEPVIVVAQRTYDPLDDHGPVR